MPPGSSSWTPQASASQCRHLTLCIEAVLGILVNLMQRIREFPSSGGGPLQAQLPCFLGRATHTPELPWRTIHPLQLPFQDLTSSHSLAWLFPCPQGSPQEFFHHEALTGDLCFRVCVWVRLPNSANKDTVRSDNKIKVSHT